MACIKCNISIPRDEQYHIVSGLSHELSIIIEEQVSNVPEDAIICNSCFEFTMNALGNTSIEHAIQTGSNNCVWCRKYIGRIRTHALPVGPQRDVIARSITPRPVPDGGYVCYRCWVKACRLSGHTSSSGQNACVWCRDCLTTRRTHILPMGSLRSEIATKISPRQITPGDRVCHPCYMAARRNIQRASNPQENTRRRALVCSNSLT